MTMFTHRGIATLMCAAAVACCSKAPEPSAAPEPAPGPRVVESRPALVRDRPYALAGGAEATAAGPSPLIVLLHGYGASAADLVEALGLASRSRSSGFLYAIPEGTEDPRALKFWNATSACCNFYGSQVDDVAYLASLIDDVKQRKSVDPERVYAIGHSNGGFMALRLACELSDRIAGIASIAGAASDKPELCRPTRPVAVLQVHGDLDWHVPYDGGRVLRRTKGATHPSAPETVARWAELNRCRGEPAKPERRDLEPLIPGAETEVLRYGGCAGGAAELWTVMGGDHFVAQHPAAFDAIYEFLEAHPAPPPKN